LDVYACKECAAYSPETCEKLEKDLIAYTAEFEKLRQRAAGAECESMRKSVSADQSNSKREIGAMENAVDQETPLSRWSIESPTAKQDSIGRSVTPGPETDRGNSDVFVLMIDVADFLENVKSKIPGNSYCCSFRLLLQFANLQKQTEKLCTDLRLKSAVGCQHRNDRKNDPFIPRTREAIVNHLIESGETAESAAMILQDMLVKDLLPDLNDGNIMIRVVQNFRHAMRLRFSKNILAGFPDWGMTQGQKTVLLDSILKTTPLATLMSEDLHEAVYAIALISAKSNDPASFQNITDLKHPIVRRRLLAAFPDWNLSKKQEEAIVENILNTCDSEGVFALVTSTIEQSIWLSVLESQSQDNATNFLPEDFVAVLKYLFNAKFEHAFPPWPLSDFQKTAVIDRIFKDHPARDLGKEPDLQMFVDALESEASHGALMCPICMEPMVSFVDTELDTSNMWFAPQRKTEHWRNQPCGHACCRSCITMWAETVIDDQKTNVKCPVDGCSYRLWDQDLKELLDKSALRRHKEHTNANYLKHLKHAVQKDKNLSTWLKAHAVPCPDCHVIVSRSQGCDVMTCVCGTKFCYACGFKKCRCKENKENRPDIWKPRK
jgi:hypothetical protein